MHCITFEIVTEIDFAHRGLLVSKLTKKVSPNLKAIQSDLFGGSVPRYLPPFSQYER